MPPEPHIRPATLDDLETIVRHRWMMFEDIGHANPALLKAAEPAYTEWLRERLANGRYQGWFMVAADGVVLAGAGLWLMEWPPGGLTRSPYQGFVFNVFTERAHRKQGFSRRLMQALLDACAAQGVNVVRLHASSEGRPLYTALGFGDSHEMRLVLPMGDGSAPR